MKRFLLYLLTVVSIVACSEGEPADNGSDNGGGNTPTTPTITLNKSSVSFDELADEESISFSTTADWIAEIVNDRADGWLSVTPQSGSAGDASITIKAKENDTPDERNASVRIKAGSASKTISVSQKQKDALTVTASKFEVEAEGGEVKIEVKANIDFEYAIDESAQEWIKYEGTRAMKTSTLTFSVAENDDTEKREGKIAIKSGEFNEVVTIYQAGSEPSIVISQNEYVVSSDGETISVEVSSNVDVEIEMPADTDWISENTTRATSTNTYRFDIQPNEDYDQRTAEIKFTNKENNISEVVKVTQVQKDALVVAKDSYTVDSDGGQLQIEVSHNVDFDIEIANGWITKAENTRAFVTETLVFNIAKNPTTDNREGTIIFKSKDGKLTQTVKVYQAQEDALIISKKDIVVSDEGGTISLELQTNVEFKVSDPDVDWLRPVVTRGLTTHTLHYEYDANSSYDSREAHIVVTNTKTNASETITITQTQKDAIVLAKDSYTIDSDGGQLQIEVGHNVDFDIEISNDWITKAENTRAFVTETLNFNIAKNPTADNREGTIVFKSKDGAISQTVKVYQAQEDALIISKKDIVVSDEGGTISFELQTNIEFTVSEPDVDWLRPVVTRGLTTHTLHYEYDANSSYDSREAHIVVTNTKTNASETITITQTQKDAIVLAKESYTVDSDGGQIQIEVGHNVDFDIEISNDWITKAENTRAFVTESIVFNIAKNPTTDNREGTIIFKSKDGKLTQTVKVYQAQEDALIISKKDIVVSDEGGTISFELQTNVDFKVSNPDVDWLRPVVTRGLTTHTLHYEYDANSSYDSREAHIVVTNTKTNASETITITQTQKDAIVLAKDSYTVDSEGGQLHIEVGHNVDFDIEISNDWITKAETRAFVTETLVFNIAKNPTYDNREGTIIFKSKDGKLTQTVKVYQAQEDALIISKKDIVVSDEGGTISFELQTNVEFKVSEPDVDWLRPVTTRALTTHTLNYTVDANTSYDSREAKIVVTDTKNNKSETITITQAQKDAIVLAKSEYEFGVDGGNLDFEIQTNVDIIVTISDNSKDWIQQVETRALETKTLYFNVSACSAEEDREGTITISGGNATQTITVKQSGLKEILEKEREALIAFYNATGGDNWTRNDNWCSDKPIEEWYGITVENGVVTNIDLRNNNLSGVISNELNKIISLKEFNIDGNHLTSLTLQNNPSLEAIICNNNKLTTLDVAGNESLGTLQCNDNTLESISLMSCKNLHTLFCDNNLLRSLNLSDCIGLRSLSIRNNKLTSLDISSCSKLFNLDCSGNQLSTLEIIDKSDLLYLWCSGNLLESLTVSNCKLLESILCDNNKLTGTKLKFYNCPNIETLWCHQNNLETLDVTSLTKLKSLWCGNFNGFEGSTISTLDISQNTLLEQFSCYGLKLTTIDVSNNPHLWKLECSGNPITSLDLSSLVNLKELWCHSMDLSDDLDISNNVELEGLYCFNNPNLAKIIISNEQEFSYEKDKTTKFCIKGSDVLYDEFPYYASTDYSKDGTVTILQKASVGKGINIVLMGDAFSDRLIDDGTYENTMKLTMENFFSIEPYTSHRDFFNVYSVTAVSKNEMCSSHSSTALSCLIGAGGNDDKVFAYAQKAVGENEIEDTAIIVILNEPLSEVTHDGLCRLWTPSSGANDYGKGSSIAYICRGSNDEIFESVIHHEAGGHGFAKLGDEYTEYSDMLQIPDNIIEEIKTLSEYGWLKNIDLTNDPITIKWSKFLNDNRYSNEQITADLGIFEGAYYYKNGVFRPSWNGVMNNNLYMNFNAPSREAIYYRIHKLAYGADWEYDYEEFVEWDARNRSTASATRGVPYRMEEPKDFKPLHAPVVMKTSWRNAKNNAPAKNATRSMGGNAGHNLQKSAGTTSHATAKPMTASTSITLPDGSVRTTTISSSGATKVEYKKTNK